MSTRAPADIGVFYAWYCGRFSGVATLLRRPEIYDQDSVVKQMLKVLEDYEREIGQVRERFGDEHVGDE